MYAHHQLLTTKIVNQIYPRLEEFTKQKKGCSADYIVNGSYCLEVKLDYKASQTGNVFIEYANKNKEFIYPSGITLSAKWEYFVLYLVLDRSNEFVSAYEIPAKTLLNLAETTGIKAETRPRANGNREGFSALGYKVKLEYLQDFFIQRVQI